MYHTRIGLVKILVNQLLFSCIFRLNFTFFTIIFLLFLGLLLFVYFFYIVTNLFNKISSCPLIVDSIQNGQWFNLEPVRVQIWDSCMFSSGFVMTQSPSSAIRQGDFPCRTINTSSWLTVNMQPYKMYLHALYSVHSKMYFLCAKAIPFKGSSVSFESHETAREINYHCIRLWQLRTKTLCVNYET